MRMSSLLTSVFEHKKLYKGSKKVYRKTRAFFTKNFRKTFGKKYFFLGAEKKIKKNDEN